MKHQAGNTSAYCGQRIRITSVVREQDTHLVGKEGMITNPFRSLPQERVLCGVYLDDMVPVVSDTDGPKGKIHATCNLYSGDTFEVTDDEADEWE